MKGYKLLDVLETSDLPSRVPELLNVGKTFNFILEKLRDKKATKVDQQVTEGGNKREKTKRGKN